MLFETVGRRIANFQILYLNTKLLLVFLERRVFLSLVSLSSNNFTHIYLTNKDKRKNNQNCEQVFNCISLKSVFKLYYSCTVHTNI